MLTERWVPWLVSAGIVLVASLVCVAAWLASCPGASSGGPPF